MMFDMLIDTEENVQEKLGLVRRWANDDSECRSVVNTALSTFPPQFLPSFGIGGGVAKILHRLNFWIYTKITTS